MTASRAPLLTVIPLAALALAVASPPAAAEAAFTGADAAYVDWGVKSCGLKGTDVARALVEAARGKGADAFNRQYMQQFQSEAFTAASADKTKRDRLCRDVREWYGKSGTRFPRALAGEGEGPQQPMATHSQQRITAPDGTNLPGSGPGQRR